MTPPYIASEDIDKKALAHRRALGFRDVQIIDGMTLITKLKHKYPNINYLPVPSLPNSAEAQWDDEKKLILLLEDTFYALNRGEPRAIMSLTHEVGHMLLGHKGILNRSVNNAVAERFSVSLKRMEAQAKRYAAAFLMPDTPYLRSLEPREIALKYGVSLAAAQIRKLELR